MVVITIEVISDIVCPWCYIGKRKLERGISLYQKTYPGGKEDVFSVTWRAYYLDENPPACSVGKSEKRESKLRGMNADRVEAMSRRLTRDASSVGINIRYGGKIGSTRDAHRLIHLGQSKSSEVQNALVEKLFEAYHELEKDISSRDTLRDIAVDAGLDGVEVGKWLDSDLAGDIVDAEALSSRKMGVSGVPLFVIQGMHRLDGAQDPQDFLEMFIKVKEGDLVA